MHLHPMHLLYRTFCFKSNLAEFLALYGGNLDFLDKFLALAANIMLHPSQACITYLYSRRDAGLPPHSRNCPPDLWFYEYIYGQVLILFIKSLFHCTNDFFVVRYLSITIISYYNRIDKYYKSRGYLHVEISC